MNLIVETKVLTRAEAINSNGTYIPYYTLRRVCYFEVVGAYKVRSLGKKIRAEIREKLHGGEVMEFRIEECV